MFQITKAVLAVAALSALGACVDDGMMPASPAGPSIRTTFDPAVSNTAVSVCQNTLAQQVDGNVSVVGTEYSEANVGVYMRVGANGAPWRCLVSNDGRGAELMFLGSEGAA
ncbi:hypothetical protein E7811_15425 [Aliigemmobacter aestuarii]|uniref:Lipoprotein n=1 Tax=Aliigemmobacter aestuarii TaxID=1445661 RepID=A0A4S3MKE1_9RHOB|nr:hypothetical protein [Gemmobacter aestuarii]THD82432.1 hypothetical protein E7811_15425 [Gemmobacter aestuarii]